MLVTEVFYSIQGEGSLTGVPSVFIRLAGCNLRCVWCDTKYASWNPEEHELTLEEVLAQISQYPARHCVLTGGEPTVSPGARDLAQALHDMGKHITIESNGTTAPDGIAIDLASLSPKLGNSVADAVQFPRESRMQSKDRRWKPDVLRQWIDRYDYQLKFVVTSAQDVDELQELLGLIDRPIPPDRVMLMPEGIDRETVRGRDETLVDLCKRFGYRYCRRLHIEIFGNKRGT